MASDKLWCHCEVARQPETPVTAPGFMIKKKASADPKGLVFMMTEERVGLWVKMKASMCYNKRHCNHEGL